MDSVSVIIPVYNCEKYIKETIKSALQQTLPPFEIIVVDDGSTDKTASIIQDICKEDKKVIYIYQKNQGVSSARNRAIKESRGDYIALLDHDDLWLPHKLEAQMRLFKHNPKLGLVCSDTIFFEDERELYSIYSSKKPPSGNVFEELLSGNFISCETVVIPKWIFDEFDEWFPEDMEMSEEYDLFLRIAYRAEIGCICEPLAKYRLHEANDHKKRDYLLVKEGYKILERLKEIIPQFKVRYKRSINSNIRTLLYYDAIHHWRGNSRVKAASKLISMLRYGMDKRVPFALPWIFFDFTLYDRIRIRIKNMQYVR